ncbi:MAG: PAS domain S-box protein [Candidatus Aminicenantes bacterium]|nr:PAS domain S-box protein [Candidatus Aminicenantes bacterium]MDH5741946.1 PAS domain S-box protein [Candidatus Aminicenantes bacterium]
MTKDDEITKEFIANILESMEGGVLTIDRNARITSFNHSAEEITGFKREEVLDEKCCDILKSELCEEFCPLIEVLETGKPVFNYEILITSKTGNEVPVNITTSPLRNSHNEIIGAVENFRDLTKHKGLWGKLREERNKAHQYLNIAGVIIIAITETGAVSLINKKGCDVLGYKEDEIIDKNWFDLCVPERDRKERKETFQKVMAGNEEEAEDYENTILTKSGEERIIAWHNTTLTDERGSIIGTLSSGEDITQRKQTEEELLRSEKLASLGQLAASVAHEVNNPLAGILVYIKLFLKKYQEKKLQTEKSEIQLLKMEKELERTCRIIRNLLDFARQSEPTMKPIEINKVIEASLLLVGNQINLENIRLEKKLAPNLLPVLADFDKIQQVLINIILNSIQAMPEGGTLTITTSTAGIIKIGDSQKNAVRIDIEDTGIGIPKENLHKLFTPFFTTKEKGKGVGLGLSVVHGIIGKHKGKIDVESVSDVGTTFTIYLGIMDEKTD